MPKKTSFFPLPITPFTFPFTASMQTSNDTTTRLTTVPYLLLTEKLALVLCMFVKPSINTLLWAFARLQTLASLPDQHFKS